jgi:hypothetical protein
MSIPKWNGQHRVGGIKRQKWLPTRPKEWILGQTYMVCEGF